MGGWPCQNHPTVRPRAYMYRRSRRGTLYVQRCTIKPSSSWQDSRRKTPNDPFPAPFSSLFLSLFPILRPSSCLSCFTEAAFSRTLPSVYSTSLPRPLSALTSKLRTARCSETLQLLAGGLASYADSRGASCAETAGNLRQFVFGIAS